MLPLTAQAFPLKIATWNMDWLLDANAPLAATAPSDIPHRTPADLTALAAYARHLNADIVGFQEVATPEIAAHIFPPDRYTLYITHDPVLQRTGVALRRGLQVVTHPDLIALNVTGQNAPHPLRSGLDLTVVHGATTLRLLVVHLKTGCWDNPLTEKAHACPLLLQQFLVLQNWISERQKTGEAFVILGDFNRRMTQHDPFFQLLGKAGTLKLATAGFASPCAGGSYFIDHVLVGGAALGWLQPNSLRTLLYTPDEQAVVSDHCPVSAHLQLPD
ncbi:hypothetical protein HK14_13295 [Acetobacter cibinongensis]|uniref:Endonuclease/exonuclease/phosphatase domain-containing protein n=2 Tax=Acetobacter cibinongensis TaxID=146475 RepID=A0A1Z5YXQ2_9PROT|nr:hypothetical protein HK14_13295 [Acetobacter cibinongensis]